MYPYGIYVVIHAKTLKRSVRKHITRFGTLSMAMSHCKRYPPKAHETLAIYWHENHIMESMATISNVGEVELTPHGFEHLAYEGGI